MNDKIYEFAKSLAAIRTTCNTFKHTSWKSKKYYTGRYCCDGEMFMLFVEKPMESYLCYINIDYWDLFDCEESEFERGYVSRNSKVNMSRLLFDNTPIKQAL